MKMLITRIKHILHLDNTNCYADIQHEVRGWD